MDEQHRNPNGQHEAEGDGHEAVECSPRDDLKVRSWVPGEAADEDA
jgi:hypothetical protein